MVKSETFLREDMAIIWLYLVLVIGIFMGSFSSGNLGHLMTLVAPVSTVAVAMAIAVIGVYAKRQKQIHDEQIRLLETQIKLNLYDKRFAMYRYLGDFLTALCSGDHVEENVLGDFHGKTYEARFLFKEDINDYLKELYDKAYDYYACRKEKSDENVVQIENREQELLSWLKTELATYQTKFDEYLLIDA